MSAPPSGAPGAKVILAEKLAKIEAPWTPGLVAALNGQHVRLARLEGAFVRHRHDDADELFLVLTGRLDLELDDGVVALGPGELYVVPRGVAHRPVARDVAEVLLFEPASVVTAGDADDPRSVDPAALRWL